VAKISKGAQFPVNCGKEEKERGDDFHYQFRTRIRNRAERAVEFGFVHRARHGWILRRWLAVPRLKSYELLPRGMHAAYACASSRVASLSFYLPFPLTIFSVTLRATILRSQCPVFKPVFGKPEGSHPVSIIDTSTMTGWISHISPCFSSSSAVLPRIRRGFQWILKIISRLASHRHRSLHPLSTSVGSHFGIILCLDHPSLLSAILSIRDCENSIWNGRRYANTR